MTADNASPLERVRERIRSIRPEEREPESTAFPPRGPLCPENDEQESLRDDDVYLDGK